MIETPLKILIVEDCLSDLELIVRELHNGGFDFEYRHCETEEEFKNNLISFNPDLVLSDHNLPSFNSTDVLIAARTFNSQIPFILISGFIAEEEAVDMIVNKGANDFILKDNLMRLNPSIVREHANYKLKYELKKKTQELKRLSLVASHTHNGVIIANNKGEIEWVNEAYTQLTGYELNDCFGQKPGDLLQGNGTNPKTIARIRKKLSERISFKEEILNYHKNGTPYWIKLDITPIIDGYGDLTNFIAIQEDITEHKKFELKLIETNSRLERAQEIGKIGHWEIDSKSYKVEWSEQIFNIYDRTLEEGNPTYEEVLSYHSDNEEDTEKVELALKNGTSFEVEKYLFTKNGVTKYIKLVGIPIYENKELQKFIGVVQDITERKKIETELYENQEKLKSLTNSIPGVLLRYKLFKDGTDSIDYISEGVEKTFELSASTVLNNPTAIWDLILNEDVEQTKKSVQESADDFSIWNCTYRIKTTSGCIKWLRGVGIPKHQDENCTVWDTILLDVTKEMEYDLSLTEANNRLLEAQELAIIGDWSIDFISKETYISPMVKKIHGVDPAFEFDIEKGLSFFKEGFDRDRKREVVEKAINDGIPYNEELKLITAQGKEKWVRSIGEAKLKNGKCIRLHGTIMDITDEKEKELVILKSEERLEAAVSGADLGLWDLNLVTREHHANKRWFEMLGYNPSDIENSLDFFNAIIHPDDAETPMNEVRRIEGEGENNLDFVLRLKNVQGNYQRVLARGKVVEFDDAGKAIRLVGTHLDITDSLELQESLSSSLEEKTILLSEIHHRVKNNLAIVSGLLELQAMENEDSETNQTLKDMAKRIKSIAGVHELLYDSKSFSSISFKKYVTNLFQNLDTTLSGNSDIEVNVNIDIDDQLEVNINQAVPLGLLINELLTNSYKYAFKHSSNPKIDFSMIFDEESYTVLYADNGPGLDKKEFENPSSLGFTLLKTLLSQLHADYELNTENQFKLIFTFGQRILGSHSNL